jgi:hypothetical protein
MCILLSIHLLSTFHAAYVYLASSLIISNHKTIGEISDYTSSLSSFIQPPCPCSSCALRYSYSFSKTPQSYALPGSALEWSPGAYIHTLYFTWPCSERGKRPGGPLGLIHIMATCPWVGPFLTACIVYLSAECVLIWGGLNTLPCPLSPPPPKAEAASFAPGLWWLPPWLAAIWTRP